MSTTTTLTHDRQAILEALRIIAPTGVVELRALDCDPDSGFDRTVSGYFDTNHHQDLATAVERMCKRAGGVYITLQDVKEDCLARASNRARAVKKKDATTTDADVVAYRWLPLDFDPIRTKGVSSTDAEWGRAHSAARAVRQALTAEGWPAPVYASSGNGAHLLYRLPAGWASPKEGDKVQAALAALIARFKDVLDGVDLDAKVFNPARIWKLYGTVARKGDPTPTRPHRLAEVIDAEAVPRAVDAALLDDLVTQGKQAQAATGQTTRLSAVLSVAAGGGGAGAVGSARALSSPKPATTRPVSAAWAASEDTPEKIADALACIPADDRDVWLAVGGALHHWGGAEARELWDDWAQSSAKFDHKGQDKAWASFGKTTGRSPKTVATVYKLAQDNGWEHPATKAKREREQKERRDAPKNVVPMRRAPGAATAAEANAPKPPSAHFDGGMWSHQPNDFDLAERMLTELEVDDIQCVADEGHLWRYTEARKVWAKVTQPDVTKSVTRWHLEPLVDNEGRPKKGEPVLISSGECRGAYWMAQQVRDQAGFFARARHGIVTSDGLWIGADTGRGEVVIEPATHDHKARAVLGCRHNPQATGPLLTHYLSTVHAGQPDEADRVRLMGEVGFAALTGLGPWLNKAILAYGTQGTGKSQWLEILSGLVPAEAQASIQPHEIANEYYGAELVGKLLNVVTECNEAEVMAESGFKAVISGEPVTRRRIRGEPFTFKPRALHVFAGNKLPPAPGATDAFWARWLPIGFSKTFRGTGSEIKNLGARIVAEELDAVLAWVMDCGKGLLARRHYTIPASVAGLFTQWQSSSDSVLAWRDERTDDDKNPKASSWITTGVAYGDYKAWCDVNGFRPVNSRTFKERLEGAEVKVERSNGMRIALIIAGPMGPQRHLAQGPLDDDPFNGV